MRRNSFSFLRLFESNQDTVFLHKCGGYLKIYKEWGCGTKVMTKCSNCGYNEPLQIQDGN